MSAHAEKAAFPATATALRAPGGHLLALGFAGITVTTGLYALAPPAAGLPVHPFVAADAIAGVVGGAAFLHAASLVGVTSDIVAVMGASLILLDLGRHDKGPAASGMTAIIISILIFTMVDAMVGTVLVPLALDPATAMAFIADKRLFDALFVFGTGAFGVGALVFCLAEARSPSLGLGRSTIGAGLVSGALGLAATVACLAGLPLHLFLGASIGIAGLVFTWIGLRIAK